MSTAAGNIDHSNAGERFNQLWSVVVYAIVMAQLAIIAFAPRVNCNSSIEICGVRLFCLIRVYIIIGYLPLLR